jgi:OOP family OmpA-OmpF porin
MRLLMMMCVAACFAVPTQDVEGSKDHPMVSRFPGYFISNYDVSDFGSHDFAMPDGTTKTVEGRYWGINYELAEGKKKGGPLEISRNYLKTFTDRGGSKVVEDVHASGGTMVAKLPVAGKTIWLQTDIINSGEMYQLYIVEEAAMEQKVEFTAMELARVLKESGSVALHNILFDTGKATIRTESVAALAPIGEVLKNDSTLMLEIVGHTDNVGAAAANLKLSRDRAAAVKTYLVQTFGIEEARLTPAGFGDTKPVASNQTDEGRAKNRRVELIKK